MKRFYSRRRQAWTPTPWPAMAVGVVLVVIVTLVLQAGVILTFFMGIAIGVGVSWGQWAIWKHRHPVIPIDEQIDAIRKNAWLN